LVCWNTVCITIGDLLVCVSWKDWTLSLWAGRPDGSVALPAQIIKFSTKSSEIKLNEEATYLVPTLTCVLQQNFEFSSQF